MNNELRLAQALASGGLAEVGSEEPVEVPNLSFDEWWPTYLEKHKLWGHEYDLALLTDAAEAAWLTAKGTAKP